MALDAWDGELSARSLTPQAFVALARDGGELRWWTRQVVRQPSEARYGRSPVRQVRSTQIRVLTRPVPPDLFQDFARSIRQLESTFADHELRLRPVEWRVRDLGIRGRGWMALLDGLLVARWIEIEELGGRGIEPAAEITYGLERLALVVSGQRSLVRLQAARCSTHAELKALEEQELSRQLLESLDEDVLVRLLEADLGAVERELAERAVVPAYEAILRGVVRAEVLRARGAFRTLREARAGIRLTELSAGCRELISDSSSGGGPRPRDAASSGSTVPDQRTAASGEAESAAEHDDE